MNNHKIYARNTTPIILDNEQANSFIEINHSQGSIKSNLKIQSIGLTHNDEIVCVAQFCSPRTSEKKREYTTELLRLCFKKNVRVIGGASKIIYFFKEKYNPTDLFTYQDTSGKNTSVYEKCGFTLVSQSKSKKYLVPPNKTLDKAGKKEKLSMAYAVKYGPDRILNEKIGEVFNLDGSRKTNLELFIQVLGWHIEETNGDKVYEWINPNISFYTYKITANDSDKYYYGYRSIKKNNPTIEDCLNDNYYGSGGNKNVN